jgi:hypothetical protein
MPNLKSKFKDKLCGKDADQTFLRINESCVYFTNNKKEITSRDEVEKKCSDKLNISSLFYIKDNSEYHYYQLLIQRIQGQILQNTKKNVYLIGLRYDGLFFDFWFLVKFHKELYLIHFMLKKRQILRGG